MNKMAQGVAKRSVLAESLRAKFVLSASKTINLLTIDQDRDKKFATKLPTLPNFSPLKFKKAN
jgi:hypothetical protein